MGERCVIGIDSGGSHTRAVCAALDGRVLGSARTGGGSPTHNADAKVNVRNALHGALRSAGTAPGDVVGLVGGMAGFDDETDRSWAEEFVAVEGLDCPRYLVNDALVAHAGAFAGGPGVIVVAGTGSLILAVTDAGEQIRNDRYHHYAGGARHLAFHALARILIEDGTQADVPFIRAVCDYWSVPGKRELRRAVAESESGDYKDLKRFYGGMAPLVTGWADTSPLASESCWWLARTTDVGVRLLAGDLATEEVDVGLEGGVATCAAFADRLAEALADSTAGRVRIRPAILDPVAGAAMLALERAGIAVDGAVLEKLAAPGRPVAVA